MHAQRLVTNRIAATLLSAFAPRKRCFAERKATLFSSRVLTLLALGVLVSPRLFGADQAAAKPAPRLQVELDASEVPEMQPWCQKSKEILEKTYPMIVERLSVDGYTPPQHVQLIFKKEMKGVAGTAGSRIFCASAWFKAHPDDHGALVHELVHVVQSYPKYDPPWLVEGIADYVRFWLYEPGAKRPPLDPAKIRYQDGYKTTAAFLAWLTDKRDKDIVRKLNAACHNNQYKETLFKDATGKDLETLWNEFKATLPRRGIAGVKILRDLEYVPGGHERNRLDLYLPEKAQGPLPLIVFIHGGGWSAGSKDGCPGVAMLEKGYAVASINYRLSQHAVFPAQIEDCKAAIRWLRANAKQYGYDASRVAVWGHSAGGHLSALLGTSGGVKEWDVGGNLDQSSRVQAVIDWSGPTDFGAFAIFLRDPNSPVGRLLGCTPSENMGKAAKASPITFVSKDSAPFLIVHGDKDNLVPLSQAERLTDALKKAGVEVTLRVLAGVGHGGPEYMNAENRKAVEEFLEKHLRANL
jgi:acetyl esterase/lipase